MKVALEQHLAVYLIQRTASSFNSSYSPEFEQYLQETP
jgi:thiamine biosynthesis lipoprotein ApbE